MENIIHMLVLCPKVKEFWNLVLEYIKSKVKTTLLFIPFNIILGYTFAEVNQQPINTILLLNLNGFIHRLHQVNSEQKLLSQLCHEEIYFNKILAKVATTYWSFDFRLIFHTGIMLSSFVSFFHHTKDLLELCSRKKNLLNCSFL